MNDFILSPLPKDFLEDQKEVLFARKPYLRVLLPQWEKQKNNLSFHKAELKGYYLLYKNVPLSSTKNPIQEMERLSKQLLKFQENRIWFFLGLGNLYFFDYLLKHRNPNQITIIIEQNEEILGFYWNYSLGFHEYLLSPNCHVITEKNLQLLWEYLYQLSPEKIRGFRFFQHLPSVNLNRLFYQNIMQKTSVLLKSQLSSLLTTFEFENLWFQNILNNAMYLSREQKHNRLIFYKNALPFPFVIIGAGPSLKESKSVLESLQNKAILLATDASLKPLHQMGIQPDFVVLLDGQIHTYFHFRGLKLDDTLIIADLVVHPFLLRKLRPLGWIFSSTIQYAFQPDGKPISFKTKGIQFVESLLSEEVGSIQSGGSVSTNAFEIARFFGSKTIFLIGQDLAWTNRQLHCVGTHHYEKWQILIHRTHTLEHQNEILFQKRIKTKVPGISTPQTYGDVVMDLYRLWFEETAVELQNQVQIFNLTKRGSKIQNIPMLTEKELKNFPEIDKSKVKEIYKFFKKNPIKPKLHPEIEILAKEIHDLLKPYKPSMSLDQQKEFYQRFQELAKNYQDLEVFTHKVETYIQRNQKKLTDEKITKLRYENLHKNLRKFLQSLMIFSVSRIQSEAV
ncbi:MAG: DUF115 domain-containing protein [Leptospiraceae bacterium]|nr:DUF115 domain-containing protein [Leptospiraceae bacterium]MDW7977032.1 DUF115 domain-containing protein [Leptospiraceae bacterium]